MYYNLKIYFMTIYALSSGPGVSGIRNTTSPITNIRFKFSTGNIDDGIIKMYGVA